jgi:hypothetical protein
MRAFIYRCSNTGYRVQGLAAEEASQDSKTYEAVKCVACEQTHLVNPATGKVQGDDQDE